MPATYATRSRASIKSSVPPMPIAPWRSRTSRKRRNTTTSTYPKRRGTIWAFTRRPTARLQRVKVRRPANARAWRNRRRVRPLLHASELSGSRKLHSHAVSRAVPLDAYVLGQRSNEKQAAPAFGKRIDRMRRQQRKLGSLIAYGQRGFAVGKRQRNRRLTGGVLDHVPKDFDDDELRRPRIDGSSRIDQTLQNCLHYAL